MTKKKTEVSIRPLGDRVLVLPDPKEESITSSGLIVPGQEENLTGVVIGVGPGKVVDGEFVQVDLTWGERVLIGRYGHDEIIFEGKKYYIVPEGSILAVIE